MPSGKRARPSKGKPAATKARKSAPASRPSKRPAPKPAGSKPAAKRTATPAAPTSKGAAKPAAKRPAIPEVVVRPADRSHLLSLAFLRDGDEFMARLETDAGQITELKNRSLDQLLSLVANELEDLLE